MPNPWDNDPIVTPAGPVFGAPAKPDIPSGYRTAPGGLAPIPGGPADPAHKQTDAPSGYRFQGDGSLQPIPGGPADPNKDAPKVGASPVGGKDYLKTLDPGTANMVQALADGRKSFPSGAALRAPYWQEMLAHVSNYDPGFDEVNYTSRSATRRDFTSGKAANNIRALNTAIGHLGHLEEQINGTASHGFVPLNAIENAGKRMMGDPGPTNFDTTVSALSGELTSVYRGAGGAEADIQRYISQMSPNLSHDQKVGVIRNIVGLLKSRLDALNDQYRQGMGTTSHQLQLLDPQAQLIVHNLGGFDTAGSPQDGSGGPMAPGGGNGGPPPPSAPSDRLTPATGQTKDVLVASLTPVRREYVARLQSGQSPAQLVSFLRQSGVSDPAVLKSATQQALFRRKNPNVPIDQYDTTAIDHITQQMSGTNKAINAFGQSDLGAGAIAAGNAMTAGFIPDVIGATGGNEEQARLALKYSAQDHPMSSLAGSIVGGTAAALGGETALAKGFGMEAGLGRSVLADTAYGAAAGAGATPENRGEGAIIGGAAGMAGSFAGQGLTRGLGSVARGVRDVNVQKLVNSDVPLTIGQTLGGITKGIEDKATSVPILGDIIQSRRAEGVRAFNSKAFDKALEPIGATVGDQVGQDAVDKARGMVSNAFAKALKGKSATVDREFVGSARGPMERLAAIKRNGLGEEIVGQIEESTKDLFNPQTGELSGENMQTFLESLRQIRESYKNDPLYARVIKPSVQGIENAAEGMFKRQVPEVMPAFNAAKQAYRRVSILSDAVNAADNTENVFVPSQLRRADLNNAKKYDGKMRAASGSAQFQDISRPAQKVLPSKVPDSGTAPRLALLAAPGAIAGTGAGLGYAMGDSKTGAEGGIGLATLLSLLYSKRGQSFLVKAAVKRGAKSQAVGSALQKLGPVGGGVGAALSAGDR